MQIGAEICPGVAHARGLGLNSERNGVSRKYLELLRKAGFEVDYCSAGS